ncbi:dehydrogenase of unknown specificity, short-chain alcohol dehydrogenase [Pseudomonas sp. GM21]|uniref:SDR family oxidoreductase n=1 Tax=Pseudomonas sp. GM21 TaxID=1144325 RepID=UPI00027258F0|nr:SDR family oxidoreductase [Pseudomonas sp. GM21]EJM24349.1 dehydrogenase of unknown specificity, short-chain alcohol dehydrogenase [Pseudomonas sp. GM21]
MMTMIGPWNLGANALVIGSGKAVTAVVDALETSGAHPFVVAHKNLRDELDVRALFERAEAQLAGRIGILVYADAPTSTASADTLSYLEWRAALNASMDVRFFCTVELARRCMADQRKGAVVHLTSRRAEQAEGGAIAAAASAGGLLTMSMSLAVEWGRDNIRSNVIATRLLDKVQAQDGEQLASLGALVSYYCSDYASYITGTRIGIDEG